MKKSWTLALRPMIVCLLLGVTPSVAANEKEGEAWTTPDRFEKGFQGILVSDLNINFQQLFSRLQANSDFPVPGSVYNCTSVEDENCKNASSFFFNSVLPICKTEISRDCIMSVLGKNDVGENQQAEFIRYVYPNHLNKFQGSTQMKIPEHAQPSIWKMSEFPHAGGDLYAVVSGLNGTVNPSNPKVTDSFYAYLFPVQQVSTGWVSQSVPNQDGFTYLYPQCREKKPEQDGKARVGCMGMRDQAVGGSQYRCVLWVDEGSDCFIQRPFPKEVSFSLGVRLSAGISGWLHGRMNNPQISIKAGKDQSTEMTISASHSEVPTYYAGDEYANLPKILQDAYAKRGALSRGGGYGRICCEDIADPYIRNSTSTPFPFGNDSISELSLWLKYATDTASAVPSMWSVRTMDSAELNSQTKCFSVGSDLKGIVTTNSTTYSDGPPTFEDGMLIYQVASPHWKSDGTIFRGNYNLVIRGDVARCVYGFSSAPISARVEVISEKGVSSVATTSFIEKDEWIYLSASNFTFSNPKIQVELTQSKLTPLTVVSPPSSTPKESKSQGSTRNAAKKSSIACKRGNKIVVVFTKNPKCPSGFKRQVR